MSMSGFMSVALATTTGMATATPAPATATATATAMATEFGGCIFSPIRLIWSMWWQQHTLLKLPTEEYSSARRQLEAFSEMTINYGINKLN